MDIPYCFVKGKAALGQLVHQKNASCVALTEVRKEDESELNNLTTAFRSAFNNNSEGRRLIGGFKKGTKSQIKFDRVQAIKEKEAIRKLNQ
jgi:large subunit ribosomal protein L7Ae